MPGNNQSLIICTGVFLKLISSITIRIFASENHLINSTEKASVAFPSCCDEYHRVHQENSLLFFLQIQVACKTRTLFCARQLVPQSVAQILQSPLFNCMTPSESFHFSCISVSSLVTCEICDHTHTRLWIAVKNKWESMQKTHSQLNPKAGPLGIIKDIWKLRHREVG